MTQAVDYSFARPDLNDLAARGYVGVLRYLNTPPNGKTLRPGELAQVLAAGLQVGVVWETTSSRAGQGYNAGRSDSAMAETMADELGIPNGVCIYYAVDYDANPDTVKPYFQGIAEVQRRRVGVYGSYRVVEAVLSWGLAEYAWQATAWSGGKHSARAHLYQRLGSPVAGTDVNDVLQDDWGQWPRGEETDLTPEEHKMLSDALIVATQAKDAAQSAAKNGSWVAGVNPEDGKSTGHGVPNIETIVTDLAAKVDALAAKVANIETGGLAGDVPFTGTIHASG